MKYLARSCLSILPLLALIACDAPIDQAKISDVPISSLQFSDAKSAAAICGRNAPNWDAAETALKANGYLELTEYRQVGILRQFRAVILKSANSDALVLIGSRGGKGACIVGAEGMTPQQSFELALPWVRQFDAQTNADRGQGLANNAVQAWGTSDEDSIVYIAAYKTWNFLSVPGAAARLIYVER